MKKNAETFHKHGLSVLILVTMLIITGCNLPVGQNAPTAVPSLSFPTAEPTTNLIVVTPTQSLPQPTLALPEATTAVPATAIPATAVPPTAIPPVATHPQPTTIPGAVRINFDTGATSDVVEGQIQPGQVMNFLLGAGQGQPLLVSTNSYNNDVTFSVAGLKDGKTLLDASQKLSSWQTMLSVTQDYLIQVVGGASKENFSLNVSTPARINFEPGAISAVRKGTTPNGLNVAYVLRANANQQMNLSLDAPDGNAVLSVYGYQDGQPYLRYVVEATTFSLKLPASQDYIIQVVPRAGEIAKYTLNITIQ
jgi:hypothetical protein